MNQLPLDLALPAPAAFADFTVGDNAEALFQLGEVARNNLPERSLYVWGEQGGGKTHLLKATWQAAQSHGLKARFVATNASLDDDLYQQQLVLIDDVGQLSAEAQIRLFDLYNHLRETGSSIVVAGDLPPWLLPVRDDLRTRLGWGLVYEIRPLDDAAKLAALQAHAQFRGFTLPDEVGHYLLNWHSRDLASLMAILDRLDKASLAEQRKVTLPLLKRVLGNDSPTV